MKAILIIDHGSRRDEANDMLACVANLLTHMVGDSVIVRHAHMELAEPSIAHGFDACIAEGATSVVAFPDMLSPGRHATNDIPELVAQAAARHPGVEWNLTPAFGVHEKLAEIVLLRAGVKPVAGRALPDEGACCWDPAGRAGTCGGACRALGAVPAVAHASGR